MRRTTWRVLRTELLRGMAPVAAAAVAVAGVAMLFNETQDWAGRWAPLAEYVRVILLVLVPFAVTAGAWQSGRERRRRMPELLSSTARPRWQPVLVSWAAVTLGTMAGFVMTWLAGAVVVAPVATYSGRGWWWTLLVALAALAAASALGVAIGRLVPTRVAAPLAGVATYVLGGIVSFRNDGGAWLVPSLESASDGTAYLAARVHLLQAGWFVALAAALLVLAAARRKRWALLPGALALCAAVPIATGDADGYWRDDPAAREQVCADGAPEVCLATVNAFLLDEVTPPLREMLARWEGVPGGVVRAADMSAVAVRGDDLEVPGGTAVFHVGNLISWNGGLTELTDYRESIQSVAADAAMSEFWHGCRQRAHLPEPAWTSFDAARSWAAGSSDAQLHRLSDDAQKDWMTRFAAAARSCDDAALAALAGELP